MSITSLVVPTYRRCGSVGRLLSALDAQTLPPDEFEVVVVVDGSEDGTREMVEARVAAYGLRGIWQRNGGRAAACNAGIRATSGDVVVLLDDDMVPAPQCLALHREAHAHAPRLGVVGAAPIVFDSTSPPLVRYMGAKFNRHLERIARGGQLGFREFYSGNFSIRREVLFEVGLYDETFKVFGNEDGELAVRLLAARVDLVYEPDALAWQHYPKEFAAVARDNVAKGRTAVILARKHPETLARLKLVQRGSWRQRLTRNTLLAAARLYPRIAERLVRAVRWLERRDVGRMDLVYEVALDFFYWSGARAALAEPWRSDGS